MISEEKINACLRVIPQLSNFTAGDFQIDSLQGYTNRNFRLRNAEHDWVLRIPIKKTNAMIDRVAEKVNTEIAAELGIAPRCSWRDDFGMSLTPTLADSKTLVRSDFESPACLELLMQTMQRLHRSEVCFRGQVDIRILPARYYQLAQETPHYEKHQQQLHDYYRQATSRIQRLENTDKLLVPSHNDLVLENILLDSHQRLWIIDWEYAAMASPYWDLATMANAAGFSPTRNENLINMYSDKQLSAVILGDYRFILQLQSILWLIAFSTADIEPDLLLLQDLSR